MIRIRNWKKFQHYKDRNPPWIKLYRELLDDIEFHKLSGQDAKTLMLLWLLASANGNTGELPDIETIAFRLRTTKKAITDSLSTLKNFVMQDDSTVLAERLQDDTPETERETERETELFEKLWIQFGKYGNKKIALNYWKKLNHEQRLEIQYALPKYLKVVEAGRKKKQFEGWINPEHKRWAVDWDMALNEWNRSDKQHPQKNRWISDE